MDNPKKTKLTSLKVHRSKQEVSTQRQEPQSHETASASKNTGQKSDPNIMITSKEQMLSSYPDVFEGISRFPGPMYHIQVNPNITPKQTPYQLVPIHPERSLQKKK